MALKELDDLLAAVSTDDRAILEGVLARNAAAETLIAGQATVYNAFVKGDEPALNTLSQQHGRPAPTPASLDIAALDARLAERVPTMFKTYLDSPEAQAAIDARAEAKAKTLLREAEASVLGRAAHLSDEIYTIRVGHKGEFGEELDTKAVDAYMETNKGKFGSLTDAYNSFVQQKRVDAAIAKGIETGIAAKQTSEVPGTSLPTAQTPLGAMIRNNAERTGSTATARGEGLDKAAQAFRALQTSHAAN